MIICLWVFNCAVCPGCGLPSATAQADDATPPPPPPVDQSSTPANTMDVQQVYNTTVGSTLSPDPGSNSTHLNITLSGKNS